MKDLNEIEIAYFDFDGIIAETEPLKLESYAGAFKTKGFDLSLDVYQEIYGQSEDLADAVIANYNLHLDREEILKIESELYLKKLDGLQPRKGILNIIRYFRDNEYWVAVCSGAREKHVFIPLKMLGFRGLFDYIFARGDAPRNKPFPDVYLAAAEKTGIEPQNSLAFEDSEKGVNAAKSAGMYVVALPTMSTINQDFSKADLVHRNTGDFYLDLINQRVKLK